MTKRGQRPAPERHSKRIVLELRPSQHARWAADAADYGCSLAHWIRSGVELMQDGNEPADQTALECLRRLVASSRGKRREAWQRAEQALIQAIEENWDE